MGFVRRLVLGALRALPRRAEWRLRLAGSTVTAPDATRDGPPPRVLVLGIYLADRVHAAEHLVERFASSAGLDVEHAGWRSAESRAAGRLGAVTVQSRTHRSRSSR
jgi:hypothetical protein